jgi:N-acetylglutamate synthase/N-acetylornithine aminotransferase
VHTTLARRISIKNFGNSRSSVSASLRRDSAPLVERAQFRQLFSSRSVHRAWLATQARLPAGFRVGTTRFPSRRVEAPKPAKMTLTLIALDRPSPDFAAVFTRNAFPGAPVVDRPRPPEGAGARGDLVNNKISNVCAPGGVEAAEQVCAETAQLLGSSRARFCRARPA